MAGSTSDGHQARPPSGIMSPRSTRSRTQSLSSDRPSTIGYGLVSPPLTVSPEAAFIAASAASQIVTNDHDSHADVWYDESGMIPAGETAFVSYAALQLVNSFLDQLLFNFLQVSKATTLAALRPAVSEVLKPKLAKDAINNADEELREYLGGGDEDDYVQPRGGDSSRDWDLELVWKRTRLRCMVYSSLGDMEEEDEDLYMEQENLEIGADEQISDVISPAVAIFLTSVLEYMGELTLTVAGQAAYHRIRASFEKDLKEGTRTSTDIADRVVVEDGDMERVALDRTLGRLWRGWKKRIRSPATMEIGGRPFSRASVGRWQDANVSEMLASKSPASDAESEVKQNTNTHEESAAAQANNEVIESPDAVKETIAEVEPAEIPLPMNENDVNEIEVPGLSYYSDDEEEGDDIALRRPKSLFLSTSISQVTVVAEDGVSRQCKRVRSASLPTPRTSPLTSLAHPEEEIAAKTEVAVGEDKDRAIEPATGTRVKDSESEGEDTATFEKAEIVTSSRVSVASSAPSSSEGGLKRSGSVRSARIIDVAGPKSPHVSRSPSMDATERGRSVSLSGTSIGSTPTNVEEPGKVKASENVSRGLRPSVQNSTTISESEEEICDGNEINNSVIVPYDNATAHSNPRSKGQHITPVQSARVPSSTRLNQAAPNIKVTILNSSHLNGSIDESIPEVPIRAPGHSKRHPSKSSSVSRLSVERTRTRESDEDHPPLPIQSHAPPRPIHTSGSSSSSATGRLKAVRTSEEHPPNHAESVARNFEELIHSNQTITYTLTPENMRGIDSPRSVDSPVLPRFPRSKTEGHSRSRSSSGATEAKETLISDNKGRRPSAISIGTNGISISNPLKSPLRSPAPKPPAPPKSPATTPKSSRVPASLARDARVPRDSTADFAEFIKSTGPPGENRPAPLRHVHGPSISSPSKTSTDSRRMSSASNRNRYQPREASVEVKKDNSDLIDFIRQGPPSTISTHRIPRHVAPFRNTMDSDHMSGAAGGRAVDATISEVRHSQASTNVTENSGPSVQSSINSHTALLRNKGQGISNMFEEDMMPKRKTRRVRDPYAIDLSDEEDDDFVMTPKPPAKKEESLAEFLRNYAPPPEPPALLVSQNIPKKKASAPSLMTRFTRNKDSKESKETNSRLAQLESRSLSSRTGTAGSKGSQGRHVPIQVSIPSSYDRYGAIESSAGRPRLTPATNGRVPMKKFEPRDAVNTNRTGTSDLAAFLRDSEPPPSFAAVPERALPVQEVSSFSKMFGRRKKPMV